VEVWEGSILKRDGALQLMLIMAYIFDFARDQYREAVIRELQAVAAVTDNTRTRSHADPGSVPTRPQPLSHQPFQEPRPGVGRGEPTQASLSARTLFTTLDGPWGAIRHATFIESRYCCLVLTRSNVQEFIDSIDPSRTQKVCRAILEYQVAPLRLDGQTLCDLEQLWTGQPREPEQSNTPSRQFYTVVSYTTYVSPKWHLVRELNVVAVATDAWPAVVDASELRKDRGKTVRPTTRRAARDRDDLLTLAKQLLAGSPSHILLAAITRTAYNIYNAGRSLQLGKHHAGTLRYLVQSLYRASKIGKREPVVPFLRVSYALAQQHLRRSDDPPFELSEPLQESQDGCVLVTSECHPRDLDRSKTTLCVYLTRDPPELPDRNRLAAMVKLAFETVDVYHTSQNNGLASITSTTQIRSTKTPWNLKQTYGIYSKGFRFLSFIHDLGGPSVLTTPPTQGSHLSRGGPVHLQERNLVPWTDERGLRGASPSGYTAESGFILYQVIVSDLSSWREKTQRQGPCCTPCAELERRFVCGDCQSGLCPGWLRNITSEKNTHHGSSARRQPGDRPAVERIFDERDIALIFDFPDLFRPFNNMLQLLQLYQDFRDWCDMTDSEEPLRKRPRLSS
jgi:hypothetical protein